MANGTDFRVNIIGDAKELLKEMEKANKQAKKTFQQHDKIKAKAVRTRKQELAAEMRVAASQFKTQKKHVEDLQKMTRKGWTEKQVFQRKERREQQAFQREQKRYQADERRAARSDRWNRFTGNRGVRAATGIAGGVAGFMIGGGIASYQKHLELAKAKAPLMGMAPGHVMRNAMSGRGRGFGSDLGFNQVETAGHTGVMARATGNIGPRELQQFVRGSGTGMSAEEGADIFGAFRQAGMSFKEKPGGSEGTKQLENSLATAVATGLEKTRFPEFAKGVVSLLAAQGAMLSGKVSAAGATATMGLLAQTDKDGFKGERGANLAMRLQKGMLNPGGGEHGQAFMLRAMGFHGGPGGKSYADALRQQQKGTSDPENLMSLGKRVIQEHSSGNNGQIFLDNLMGIGMDNAKTLLEGIESGTMSPEKLKAIAKDSGTFEEKSLSNMQEMGKDLKIIAQMWDKWAEFGKEFAPSIQKLQEFQQKTFGTMVDILRGIKAGVESLVDLYRGDKNTGKAGTTTAVKEEIVAVRNVKNATSMEEHIKALKDREDALRKYLSTSEFKHSSGVSGFASWLTDKIPGVSTPGVTSKQKEEAKRDLEETRSLRIKEEAALHWMKSVGSGVTEKDLLGTGSTEDIPKDLNLLWRKQVVERSLDRQTSSATKDGELVVTPDMARLITVLEKLDNTINKKDPVGPPININTDDARRPGSPQ